VGGFFDQFATDIVAHISTSFFDLVNLSLESTLIF